MSRTKRINIKKIFLAIFLVIVLFVIALFTLISFTYLSTPLDKNKLSSSNLGIEIYNSVESETPIYYSSDKKIISATALQPHTLNAFIAIEDKRFYKHNGYDLKRIAKATLVNLKNRSKSQGASTITQQLVKNILLNSEKTYSRKVKELMLAIKTEKNFSKEEILNMYLNSIYFGSNAYGIESASNLYFDKSASELSINESAILAGIIKSPVYYSPINHPDKCFARKNLVLKQMLDNGYISIAEYNENKAMPVNISFKKNNYDNSYNQQVIIEACELLNISEKELLRQELKVYTYLDDRVQQAVENSIYASQFNADKLSLVADNNGHIIAYCGDSYFDLSHMKRNPASTVKPLLLYLPAISSNTISPASPMLDEKLDGGYAPNNAGDKYLGWISARDALAHSSNVCAVTLLNQLGLSSINEYGYKLNLFNNYQSNPSIALGDINGGVGIINLARAYTVLQNNGIDKGLTFIQKIEDKNGNIVYSNQNYTNQLFNEEDCILVNDMLKSCAEYGTAKRLNDLPFEVASKTGTALNNDKNTDLWNVAYTTEHLALSWCGDATSKGLDQNASSGFYPTMINKKILSNIYSTHKPANFRLNDKVTKVAIDSIGFETNHTLALAPDNALERYKIYDLFKVDNLPEISSTYSAPDFNLQVELTTNGAKLTIDYNDMYSYEVFASSGNSIRLIGDYSSEIYDEQVFSYNNLEYYAVATNKYTKQRFVSEKIHVNPQEYLIEQLNQQYVARNKQTKTKWYV